MIEFEVVKILYLETLESSDSREEPIKLRLEILKSWTQETYHARLFRSETYELQESFGSKEVWGKEILIRDFDQAPWDEITGDSVDSVIKAVLDRLPYS